MVGGHFIDQPDLDSVADGELPVDGGAVGTGGPVQEPPVHGGAGGLAVDLDHVVFPLDALCAPVAHAAVVHVGVLHAGVVHAAVVVISRRRTHRACREQLHAALWAVTRLIAYHLWMHWACVGRHGGSLGGEQFHATLGAAAGLGASDIGMHRTGVDDRTDGLRHGSWVIHLRDKCQDLIRGRS